jgi:hypothetical protein
MPTYCYTTEDRKTVERLFPAGEAPPTIMVDDKVAHRDYRAERVGVPATAGWPMECFASGVHASQAGELREFLDKKGVPTEVTKDGDPVYRSASHRRKALKVRGLFDRNSFD